MKTKDKLGLQSKREWLVKDLIGRQDIVFVYGQPGTGKTFIAIDLLMSAAEGKPFAGQFEVQKPLNIAISAYEGGTSIEDRFLAAMKYHEISESTDFVVIDDGPQFYEDCDGEEIDALIREWKAFQRKPLDILIIDTYAMATIGADENSAKATGRVVSNARKIAKEMNCAVVFVHHSTKSGSAERGSSAIRGAADMMIEVGNGQLRCTKAKHCAAWKPLQFKLVPFGETLVVEWSGSGSIHDAIVSFLANQQTPVTMNDIISEIGHVASHMTIKNAAKKLIDDGCIQSQLRFPDATPSKSNPMTYFVEEW